LRPGGALPTLSTTFTPSPSSLSVAVPVNEESLRASIGTSIGPSAAGGFASASETPVGGDAGASGASGVAGVAGTAGSVGVGASGGGAEPPQAHSNASVAPKVQE
jgi:hypothetical protein